MFPPEMLCKTLVKRKKNEEEEITNDSDGFINYFSAPNIRNKIKNPIFLAYRFSNFISLYYNSVKIGNPTVSLPLYLGSRVDYHGVRSREGEGWLQELLQKVIDSHR